MTLKSSGILLFRFRDERLQVMLAHPGGPFWMKKDDGAWSIPKGLFEDPESPLDAARREFKEETGFEINGKFISLGNLRQRSRKEIYAWAIEGDLDQTRIVSNKFMLEWPKKSGIINEYPEIDKANWFDIDQAMKKIQEGQVDFINRLVKIVVPKNDQSLNHL